MEVMSEHQRRVPASLHKGVVAAGLLLVAVVLSTGCVGGPGGFGDDPDESALIDVIDDGFDDAGPDAGYDAGADAGRDAGASDGGLPFGDAGFPMGDGGFGGPGGMFDGGTP
jgi:hypothetical protein